MCVSLDGILIGIKIAWIFFGAFVMMMMIKRDVGENYFCNGSLIFEISSSPFQSKHTNNSKSTASR
jgi:hypothetical protein